MTEEAWPSMGSRLSGGGDTWAEILKDEEEWATERPEGGKKVPGGGESMCKASEKR